MFASSDLSDGVGWREVMLQSRQVQDVLDRAASAIFQPTYVLFYARFLSQYLFVTRMLDILNECFFLELFDEEL